MACKVLVTCLLVCMHFKHGLGQVLFALGAGWVLAWDGRFLWVREFAD